MRQLKVGLAMLWLVLISAPLALAQDHGEWEYLVVSYGTTYFTSPALNLEGEAGRSKILLLSELGITLPEEATELQRDIDVLGRFGWELVAVVGTIGGDQQLVFKRPYDEGRSAQEAERIRDEREALLAAYNALPTPGELVELDAFEAAQALAARHARDEAHVRSLVNEASQGFKLLGVEVRSRAANVDGWANVIVIANLDVADAALVDEGQYRQSLVTPALREFHDALLEGSLGQRMGNACSGTNGRGRADIVIQGVIVYEGTTHVVGTMNLGACFQGP